MQIFLTFFLIHSSFDFEIRVSQETFLEISTIDIARIPTVRTGRLIKSRSTGVWERTPHGKYLDLFSDLKRLTEHSRKIGSKFETRIIRALLIGLEISRFVTSSEIRDTTFRTILKLRFFLEDFIYNTHRISRLFSLVRRLTAQADIINLLCLSIYLSIHRVGYPFHVLAASARCIRDIGLPLYSIYPRG